MLPMNPQSISFLAAAAAASLWSWAAFSGEVQPVEDAPRASLEPPLQVLRLAGPASDTDTGAGAAAGQGSTRINPELLPAIATWLSSNYDLPAPHSMPAVEFVPAELMPAMRHRDVPSDIWSANQASAARHASSVVALYDDADRTIYLPEAWTGSTPVELSVLVHEMVHDLQNEARITFACPEAREELAYAAQRHWLALHGQDFFTEFETDPFTLLVRTICVY